MLTVAAVAVATNRYSVTLVTEFGRPGSAIFLLKEQPIEVEGTVKVVLPGTMFRVELDNKHLTFDKARITWRLR